MSVRADVQGRCHSPHVTVVAALLIVATVGLSLLLPSNAGAVPLLSSSRKCAVAGTRITLTLTQLDSTPATITVTRQKLRSGSWVAITTDRPPFITAASHASFTVAPPRGRYRYWAYIQTATGTRRTGPVEVAIVGSRVVALTFDDGPSATYTSRVLQVLKARDVRATFFMLGAAITRYPTVGRAVVRAGHEVGNHSYTHPYLTRLSSAAVRSQLTRTQTVARSKLGVTPRYARPPYGATSSRIRTIMSSLSLRHTMWSVDTNDWKVRSSSRIAATAVNNTRRDSVVLMHDGGGNRSATVGALPSIIKGLRAKGYDFVTLSELTELKRYR